MQVSEITLAERFAQWQPSEDEQTYPENAWFYRAFDCLRSEFPVQVERWNGLFHNAICWGHGEAELVLKSLVSTINEMKEPSKPYEHTSCDYEPSPANENDAYEIFKAQFKAKWPTKRINSKFAQEKWESVKTQAQEIANEQFKARHDAWAEREARRNAEHGRKVAEWQVKVDEIADLRAFAKQIQGTGVPDTSSGDVIAVYPDGTIVLDDGITTWNPDRTS